MGLTVVSVILRRCGKALLDCDKKDFSQITQGNAIKI